MEYFKLTLFILITILTSSAIVLLSFFKSRKIKNTHNQRLTYECGFENNPAFSKKFDVKFYVIAISFLIFDIEILFFMLLARFFKNITQTGFLYAGGFLLILSIAFLYEWSKGVFKCQKQIKN